MGKVSGVRPPALLSAEHVISSFDSGEASLDDWLKRRALANQTSGASRTFVVAGENNHVWGYYALATGAVTHAAAGNAIRRNMPDPVPVMVLGRLAVDRSHHGVGLGADLLRDALLRTTRLAQEAGIRALLVHALHEQARTFYLHHGFAESAVDPLVLMLRIRVAH
ncbi:MAG: GNAT family N-acetyltransferase [Burkholderiaceae bacterium]|nr:GNAT family N-acetyltransferase [Burkholderiaceae bacterium]